jgi:hypothetical protein
LFHANIDNVLDDEITTKQAKRLSINDLLEDYSEESSDTSNSSMEISDSTSCTGSDSSEGSSENQLPSEIAVFSILCSQLINFFLKTASNIRK